MRYHGDVSTAVNLEQDCCIIYIGICNPSISRQNTYGIKVNDFSQKEFILFVRLIFLLINFFDSLFYLDLPQQALAQCPFLKQLLPTDSLAGHFCLECCGPRHWVHLIPSNLLICSFLLLFFPRFNHPTLSILCCWFPVV